MSRLFIAIGVLTLVLAACGGDDDDGKDDAGSALSDGGLAPDGGAGSGGAGTGAAGTGGAGGAGSGGTGGAGTGGTGTGGAGSGGAGTGGESTAGAGAGGGGTGGSGGSGGSGIPTDGEQLSMCFSDAQCNGDDLVCFGDSSSGAGFCTEDCATDSDCGPIAGLEATCSAAGECRVVCQDENDTNCPPDMECRDLGGGNFNCVYPEGTGAGTKQEWESCDLAVAGGECSSGLVCYRPGFPMPTEGIGYCAQTCADVSECTQPDNVTAVIECGQMAMGGQGYCRLDCSAQDATCPDGMECENLSSTGAGGGGGGMQRLRCRYPAE